MSQKIVTLCDAHQVGTDDEVPGVTWEVTLTGPGQNRATTWEVDLCEDHGKTLADLAVMLGTVGRVTDGPRRVRKATAARASTPAPATAHTAPGEPPTTGEGAMVPVPCPVDGCGKVPRNRNALIGHLRAAHGMSIAKAYGRPEPFECPEVGCDFTSSRPQGLAAHRHHVHGYSPHRAGESSAG
jgi:hypothetical protein